MSDVDTSPTTMSEEAATISDPSTKALSDETANTTSTCTQGTTPCSSNNTAIMFNSLPKELFGFIATFSSVQDLLTLAQTSKSMHQTVCDLHRPCEDCGESVFRTGEIPLECTECKTVFCSQCHTYCESCWKPCCGHTLCSHCDMFLCSDCSEMQSCQTCDRNVCDECLQVCSDCGKGHGQECIRSCPCCDIPVCRDCHMAHIFGQLVMVRVGEDDNGNVFEIMFRMQPDDEEEEGGNESSLANDDGNFEIVD